MPQHLTFSVSRATDWITKSLFISHLMGEIFNTSMQFVTILCHTYGMRNKIEPIGPTWLGNELLATMRSGCSCILITISMLHCNHRLTLKCKFGNLHTCQPFCFWKDSPAFEVLKSEKEGQSCFLEIVVKAS